ncbi:hypothetical protein ACYOEI_36370 [Singulisphaera rosea]
MCETVDRDVAWVQGLLYAFSQCNGRTNEDYTFTLEPLPKPTSLREAVEGLFQGSLEPNGLTFNSTDDPPALLRQLLNRWLFPFDGTEVNVSGDQLQPYWAFLGDQRKRLVDEVVGHLAILLKSSVVWKVEVRTSVWYEAAYDDVAFELPGRVFYLHFGVSD